MTESLPTRCTTVWLCVLAFGSCRPSESAASAESELVAARRMTLPLRVRATGELSAKDKIQIKSGVEGEVSVIYLIPEGSEVKQGDRLVELDVSRLIDDRANQAIDVENAEAALVSAQQDQEILEKEISADIAAAESQLKIARIDLEKLLGRPAEITTDASAEAGTTAESKLEGRQQTTNRDMLVYLKSEVVGTQHRDLPGKVTHLLAQGAVGADAVDREVGELAQQILKQLDEIKLAKGRLALARDTHTHSVVLASKGYITGNELDRDALEYETTRSQVVQAWNDLDLLISYSLQKECIDLVQKVRNASLAVEKVRASSNARRAAGEAELGSKQAEYALAKERLDNYDKQIAGATIDAPTPGLVVYSKERRGRGRDETVEEGMMVREGQTLIELPDTRQMIVDVKIQEAEIDRVVVGQRATIKVEAYPTVFVGEVVKVAPLPDSTSRRDNSDFRVYKSQVSVEGGEVERLRPGMVAKVEIAVGEIPAIIAVPITAVRRQGSVHYCWVDTAEGPVARRVTIGVSNHDEVEIEQGLRENEMVYVEAPTGISAPRFEQPGEAAGTDATR